MEFTKQEIAEFKSKGRSYISWRKALKPNQIKECFYNVDENLRIKQLFSDRTLKHCYCNIYGIVVGDYMRGIKYTHMGETFYMFWSANTSWSTPQEIAIGKAVDGNIYFIRERFPCGYYSMKFMIVPERYVNTSERGFKSQGYEHQIFVVPSKIEEVTEELTDNDVKCMEFAYDGVLAFSKLIKKFY